MQAAKKTEQHEWAKFLKFFSEQNCGRPTRLGVFERQGDVVNDYWLENGLPLIAIDINTKPELPTIDITAGDLTHEIKDAVKLTFHFGLDGDEDGIDIATAKGQTTILRFETKGTRTPSSAIPT